MYGKKIGTKKGRIIGTKLKKYVIKNLIKKWKVYYR